MKNNRTGIFAFVSLLACFLVTAVCILSGSFLDEGYNIEVGMVSPAKIVAPRQIVNTYATEKKRKEAAQSVTPLYKLDQQVSDQVLESIRQLFGDLEQRKMSIAQDEEAEKPSITVPTPTIISEQQFEEYAALPRAVRIDFRDTLLSITETIMNKGIKDEADAKSLLYARDDLNIKPWSENIRNLGYTIVTSALEPNLVIDEEATEAARKSRIEGVQPVIVLLGQKIIDEGEPVTEEVFSLLSELNLVVSNREKDNIKILGAIALSLTVFSLFCFYVFLIDRKLLRSKKDIALFSFLFIVTIIMVRFMNGITFYLIPVTIPAILISILLEQRLALFTYLLTTVLCSLVYKGDLEFLMFFTLTATASILVSRFTFERARIILVGIFICFFNFILVSGINLFFYTSFEYNLMFNSLLAIANGILSLLVAIGSLPIWEATFDIITPYKLLDLTSPNKELMRRLTIEAPGTYHHSLIVANLAEQAALDIEANSGLARVGGYYHDIGKLKHPYYFSENQAGENPHDSFDPYDSARIIMQHIPLGIELATTFKLPKVIKEIINQHHGTTLVKYFYHKALTEECADPPQEKDFRYPGQIPSSKEAAIVMLADTAEAAVRSMVSSSKSMEEVEDFLKVLIKDKLDDAQLDNSQLTINDLIVIRSSFMKVFRGMYHERVKYPSFEKSEDSIA